MASWMQRLNAVARQATWLAAFGVAALAVVPKGLSLFALCLLLSTLLMPQAFFRVPSEYRRDLAWMACVPVCVLLVAGVSMGWTGQGLQVLDNPARLLLIPWCACLAWAAGIDRRSLWLGALSGLAVAFAIALLQVAGGDQRVDAGANPIVFANAVLVLLVIAVFCRPAGRAPWVMAALALSIVLAVVTVVLSGSRGALPGIGLVLLVLLVGGDRRRRWVRLGMAVSAVVLMFVLMWTVPWLSAQTRLDAVHSDWDGYARGQVDTPIGARLALLSLAGDVFQRAPWTGSGIDRFGDEVERMPACADATRHLCQLRHAHNDVAQWSATLGIPGLLALLMVYGVPLALAASLVIRSGDAAPIGAGWAAGMLVAVHVLSGLTQFMFAHALTTSLYAILAGLLLGMAMREASDGGAGPGSSV